MSLVCGRPISWHLHLHTGLAEPKCGHTHAESMLPSVLPASLHGYMFLLNYSWEDILIPPRQLWKENRIQQTTNINPGQEPGL